jgi:hypothetical protein
MAHELDPTFLVALAAVISSIARLVTAVTAASTLPDGRLEREAVRPAQ